MSWIRTYTGRSVWPLEPRVADIDIEDIAHALSMQCRFGGHTRYHYSVAQHCVLLADRAMFLTENHDKALALLLHDASEAYLVDFPRPVKKLMPEYAVAEERLQSVIHRRFQVDVDEETADLVTELDNAILYDEAWTLFDNGLPFATRVPNVDHFKIEKWKRKKAKRAFLEKFKILTRGKF